MLMVILSIKVLMYYIAFPSVELHNSVASNFTMCLSTAYESSMYCIHMLLHTSLQGYKFMDLSIFTGTCWPKAGMQWFVEMFCLRHARVHSSAHTGWQ